LINYCRVDITLSEFARIYKHHCNLHLKRAFEDIVNYGRFVDFRKVVDVMLEFPDQNFDSFQYSQLESKKWLIQNMNAIRFQHVPAILVVGGWHGVLALMLKHYAYFPHTVITTDIDPDCTKIAQTFDCVASTVDMFDIEYDNIPYDFIINTSCEHIDFDRWIKLIPKGKLVALQSSDLKWETHIDNVYSIEEFINRAGLTENYIAEKRFFDFVPEQNRYLLIGRK
jgi:hypothetical protein